ncbi:MAG: ATP-binding cassette domain-containing protein [Bacteroidetes bacterium]|nr:ATP-binding cassette domain-containing protein [Bacteroidota bacterium]
MELILAGVSKTYPNGVKALNDVSINIGKGMFGLLGPNGAGKSSLMRTIATLQRPDTGSVQFGAINVLEDPMALRRVLGYLPQEFGVYPKMTAQDLLEYFARLKGVTDKKERTALIDELLALTNLLEVRHKHVDGFSGGMKQRFGIAQLLLNKPRLIIVDEPTAGLDPAERNRFLNVLREVASSSVILFSTHLVDDIQDLCNDMAILNGGRVLLHERPSVAVAKLEGQIWTAVIEREALDAVEQRHNVLSSRYVPDQDGQTRVQVRVQGFTCPAEHFEHAAPSLEDVYFAALHQEPIST